MKKNIPISPSSPPKTLASPLSFIQLHATKILLFIACVLYANTLFNAYALDDFAVITNNIFTQKGIAGLQGIFSNDSFYGLFQERSKELLTGGRYRPFTIAMFAVEYQLFGAAPWIGHLVNLLLFAATIYCIFRLLQKLLSYRYDTASSFWIAFITALLFAVHPIHTEAVANIKGRDEIMALLCSLLALWALLLWSDYKKPKYLAVGLMLYFVALLSKENAIVLIVWLPTAWVFFKNEKIKTALINTLPILAVAMLFLIIRYQVLGANSMPSKGVQELMNNPFLKQEGSVYIPYSFAERLASVFYCLLIYIQLLLVPHPLTHDYYPRYVPLVSFATPWVMASLLVHVGLVFISIKLFMQRHILGFAALIYFSALSIVSNLFFTVGTHMGERFIYMSSLGFCLMMAYFINALALKNNKKKIALLLLTLLTIAFGIKTISRNTTWKNDETLFANDIKHSPNSAKINNALGGALAEKAQAEQDPAKRKKIVKEALLYVNKAITLHPTYKVPYLTKGSCYFMMNDFEESITQYGNALRLDPEYSIVKKNLPIVYKGAGKYAGETEHNNEKALSYLQKAYQLDSTDYETVRLLGTCYGFKNEHATALSFFLKAANKSPNNPSALRNVAVAYRSLGDIVKSDQYLNAANKLEKK